MKNKLLQIVTLLAAILCTNPAKADLVQLSTDEQFACTHDEIDYCTNPAIRMATRDIILDEMTVWTHPITQEVTYATSCRNQLGGCVAHVERVVNIIFDLSCPSGFDPFMVLAMAKHESNYNPFAVNRSSGAVGLLQLMPGSPFARGVRYIHSPQYRDECRDDDIYCQQEIVYASFRLLHRSIGRCGDIDHGLGMYGSGSCRGSRQFVRFVNSYSEEVRLRSILLSEEISSNGSSSIRAKRSSGS